jgi:Na+-driven multidrug efflux pump
MPQMIPFAISQTYSETLRETGETILPMKAGIVAVCMNLFVGYGLIFGQFGFPKLGVFGAAVATVLSRIVEAMIVVIWTHHHQEKNKFIAGAFKNFRIPPVLAKQIVIKGLPLLINETLWSAGMAFLVQCYSTRGLAVVAGINISGTVSNLFNVVFIAMGSAIAIIIGQLLGAGKMEEAKDTDRKMIAFSVFCCMVIGCFMMLIAPFFPLLYNTTDTVRALATRFIIVSSLCMPLYAFMHACYFTLRSGGKTIITFLFDSVYVWVVDIPLALVLTRFTGIPILPIYIACQLIEIVKCIIGYVLVKKGVWINNMVAEDL